MVDFLVAAAQALCIIGLLYGAYLSIVYGAEESASSVDTPARFDPVTTHVWYGPVETLADRLDRLAR